MPASPHPRLLYDAVSDGILPNDYYDPVLNPTHIYHDWDGAARGGPGIKALGEWDNLESKTGSLFKALHYLAAMQTQNRGTLCCRTGSYDFGATPQDQEISTQAYHQVSLLANSDARFTDDEAIRGGHLYWCRPDDRFRAIEQLEDAHLVQLAVTRDVSFHRVDDVNNWFAKNIKTCSGPGVHRVVLMTHAMFMRGAPGPFRSLEGGSFEVLDQHLAWVRANHPDVEFVTASEAVTEFLDCYSPKLIAVVDPRLIDGDPEAGFYIFGAQLLGEGIYVDNDHPARIDLIAPACFRPSEIFSLEARVGAEVAGSAHADRVSIVLTTRIRPVTLAIHVHEHARATVANRFLHGTTTPFHDFPERAKRPLLELDRHNARNRRRQVVSILASADAPEPGAPADAHSYALTLSIGAALSDFKNPNSDANPSGFDATFRPDTPDHASVHFRYPAPQAPPSRWSQWRDKAAKPLRG